jgi:hypothetical protein
MLITPALSDSNAPSDGSNIGVVTRRIDARNAALNIPSMTFSNMRRLFRSQWPCQRLFWPSIQLDCATPPDSLALEEGQQCLCGNEEDNYSLNDAHDLEAHIGVALHELRPRAHKRIQQTSKGNHQRVIPC